jgi:hypothetical protein
LVQELTVAIDDELGKEMSRYPEEDWTEVVRKTIRKCITCKETLRIYDAAVESALAEMCDAM